MCSEGRFILPFNVKYIWATTWQNQQSDCVHNEDSDQPGHSPSLIRVFAVRMKKPWALSYPLSAQGKLIRLGGCPGWFESLLGASSFCWFCHVAGHMIKVPWNYWTILSVFRSILVSKHTPWKTQRNQPELGLQTTKWCIAINFRKLSKDKLFVLSQFFQFVIQQIKNKSCHQNDLFAM